MSPPSPQDEPNTTTNSTNNPFIAFRRTTDTHLSTLLNTLFTLPSAILQHSTTAAAAREACLFPHNGGTATTAPPQRAQCDELFRLEAEAASARRRGMEMFWSGDVEGMIRTSEGLAGLERRVRGVRRGILGSGSADGQEDDGEDLWGSYEREWRQLARWLTPSDDHAEGRCDDAYAPETLEAQPRLAHVAWRTAYEDLMLRSSGTSSSSSMHASPTTITPLPRTIEAYARDHSDQPGDPPTTELDAYEGLASPPAPSTALTPIKEASLPTSTPPLTQDQSPISTVTTTERNIAADGTVTTRTVSRRRFRDGREESEERVETGRVEAARRGEERRGWFWGG